MSGVEILANAAIVVQIADLGARLSVKLFVFSWRIKSADKTIDRISQDIAATGAVLQQPSKELYTKEVLATAESLFDSCMKVFAELDASLDGRVSNHSVVMGWKQRLKFPFLRRLNCFAQIWKD